MHRVAMLSALTLLALHAPGLSAQTEAHGRGHAHGHAQHDRAAGPTGHAIAPAHDTAFAALQERGRHGMGVDQYTSTHRFEALPDGGRIELTRSEADSQGVAAIRAHLNGIAHAFAGGDFATPRFVHAGEVPGSLVLAARRGAIRYRFRPLRGGGEVRIVTTDPEALAAVHEFLAFQRREHRTE